MSFDLDSSGHSSQNSQSSSDRLKVYEEQFLFDFEESVRFGDIGHDQDPSCWDESSASTEDA
jgi:hypothetical protein